MSPSQEPGGAADDAGAPARRATSPLLALPRTGLTRALWVGGAWAGALALTLLLTPYIGRAQFVFFWIAVLVAAWVGGLGAAVVAAVGAVVAVNYFVIPPVRTLRFPDVTDLLTLAIFVAASTLVSSLAAARARAQRRTLEHAQRLEQQAEELERRRGEAAEAQRAAEDAGTRVAAAAERAGRLLAVASGLNRAATPEEVADVIYRDGLAAIGADAGSLALVRQEADGRTSFEIVRSHGYSPNLMATYRRFPLHPGRPLSDALLSRTPRLLGSRADWERDYPEVAAELTATGYEAFAAVPVMSGGRVLAAVSASFREPVHFDDDIRTFLASLGEQCGLALERARAFEAEHQAREFSAGILASIRDGFVAVDRELRYTYVNARAEEILRRPARELLGRTIWEAFPRLEGTAFGQAFRRVLTTHEPETVEGVLPATGTGRLEARFYPRADGLTVFFQDVTARRREQEANAFLARASRLLSASLDYETTLRSVAEAAVPALGDWCAVDVVEDPTSAVWPPRIQRLAVVHRDPAKIALGIDLVTRYPTDWAAEGGMAAVIRERRPLFLPAVTDEMLVAGARDPAHLELLRQLGFSAIIVVPLVARDLTLGALTLCMSESGRRYDEADLALARDLARRAATAVDNARLYRDAEAANRAKSQFLSTMSHELRTPLNAIAGYVDLLEMELHGPITGAQREDLARIRRGAKVLMSLINDVLNFARIEAARVDITLGDVDLAQTLADLETLIAPQLRAKQLAYDHDGCASGVHVRADAERLKQILLNLLTNAIKFTAEGGRISVSCEQGPGVAPASGVVRIRVSDTGRGIAADQLERIFEPFVQVDRHLTHESQQGVGLGLAISRDLARLMAGNIEAESEVNVGSTFTLTLPRGGSREQ